MPYNYKELSDKAFKLHSMKQYEDAENLYKMLLEISPEDVNILNLYGLLCVNNKNYDKAISLLSKAVVLSKSPSVLLNLGKAYLSNNEYNKAIKIFKDVIMAKPNDDALYSLAIAYKKNKMPDKAIECYKLALKINPSHYNACYNLTIMLRDKKLYDEAIEYANKCLEIKPNSEEIFIVLSYIYELKKDYAAAIKNLELAAEISPKEYLYYYNLGVLYSKLKNYERAEANYLKVLFLKPDYFRALVNLSSINRERDKNKALEYILKAKEIAPNEKNVLLNSAQIYRDLFRNTESIADLNQIIKLDKTCHEAYSLLGANFMDLGEYKKALVFYSLACKFQPNNPVYRHGKSIAEKYCGNTEKAQHILEEILSEGKASQEMKISLGMIYLANKDFYKGMDLYRVRNNDIDNRFKYKDKIWNPNVDIKDKNIVVYSNCGLGDTLMFSRYLNFIKEIGSDCVLQTDPEFVDLFKHNFPDIKTISKLSETPQNADVILPIMDLPYALKKDFSQIPFAQGYLHPDKALVKKVSKLDELNVDKIKVGLFWQGNKCILKNRSIEFSKLKPIMQNDKFQFYSFQLNFDNPKNQQLVHLSKYITNYNDTAALLDKMDLLITIDSSVLHMAGAMGKKAFLLLPYTPEWRWFNDNEKTPWYDSVKIFKQTNIGDWDEVITRINSELNNL